MALTENLSEKNENEEPTYGEPLTYNNINS
jgi:hypothetical protein